MQAIDQNDRGSNQQAAPEPGPSVSGKLPYASPVLTVFGSVRVLTGTNAGSGTDGGTAGATMSSDINCKDNIVRIGEHPLGMGLYLFDYKQALQLELGHGRQFGVLAQEVELIMPSAVSLAANGYKQVDYSLLGISHPLH